MTKCCQKIIFCNNKRVSLSSGTWGRRFIPRDYRIYKVWWLHNIMVLLLNIDHHFRQYFSFHCLILVPHLTYFYNILKAFQQRQAGLVEKQPKQCSQPRSTFTARPQNYFLSCIAYSGLWTRKKPYFFSPNGKWRWDGKVHMAMCGIHYCSLKYCWAANTTSIKLEAVY